MSIVRPLYWEIKQAGRLKRCPIYVKRPRADGPEATFVTGAAGLFAVPCPKLCRDLPHRLFPCGKYATLCIRCGSTFGVKR